MDFGRPKRMMDAFFILLMNWHCVGSIGWNFGTPKITQMPFPFVSVFIASCFLVRSGSSEGVAAASRPADAPTAQSALALFSLGTPHVQSQGLKPIFSIEDCERISLEKYQELGHSFICVFVLTCRFYMIMLESAAGFGLSIAYQINSFFLGLTMGSSQSYHWSKGSPGYNSLMDLGTNLWKYPDFSQIQKPCMIQLPIENTPTFDDDMNLIIAYKKHVEKPLSGQLYLNLAGANY
ncbi:hypothetical protein ACJX0J_032787 [Zea mays]